MRHPQQALPILKAQESRHALTPFAGIGVAVCAAVLASACAAPEPVKPAPVAVALPPVVAPAPVAVAKPAPVAAPVVAPVAREPLPADLNAYKLTLAEKIAQSSKVAVKANSPRPNDSAINGLSVLGIQVRADGGIDRRGGGSWHDGRAGVGKPRRHDPFA